MTPNNTVPCRYCREPVHPEAVKCRHCGETLSIRSHLEQISKKAFAYIGILTALLSLFYALKEGYFYIEQLKQKRVAFTSYMGAAERFQKFGNLEYAEAALQQAIALNPTDRQLRRRHFLVRSQILLRKVDPYKVIPEKYRDPVSKLIINGFSILDGDFTSDERAKVLTFLGRLLWHDQHWSDKEATRALFAEAHQLTPDDAVVAFWYGQWLLYGEDIEEGREEEALKLINQAIQSKPDNARYWAALGKYQKEKEMYADALESFMTAIKLGPRKSEMEHVRAANEAKYYLLNALLSADKKMDITSPDFHGLSMEKRNTLVDFALKYQMNDRYLQLLAARFFYAAERLEEAEALVRKALGKYNKRSDTATLELFAAILEARGTNPETLAEIRALLAAKQKQITYEEILEVGDRHYKLGLRVALDSSGNGVEVLRVFEGYAFAKAGVRAGDRLLEFAHRKVKNLRSIWLPLTQFEPGTDVPLKVRRGDQVLELTLIVE